MVRKSKIPNQIQVRIPKPEVWKDFVEFVEERYGTNYVVTGIELQKAIEYHLGMEGWGDYPEKIEEGILVDKPTSHTHNDESIKPDDRILIQTIYKEVQPGTEIYFNLLCKWMRKECGLDDTRTHKKHVNKLVALGVLKDVEGNYTAYEVLDPGDL
ncbi:hypothetical protein [Methanobacterium spitsbergense]|uniref:Uncharacterized protein n=1 Tax=Methanobacterium spitsbergense TaxID=2874285 RepID=A0A8T5V009_9EURY|nr:hypothetical protein [Methanobacterium spitsbergense]MBZ2166373.1 hypothetical protein [Methanobacterium spitsbergense]